MYIFCHHSGRKVFCVCRGPTARNNEDVSLAKVQESGAFEKGKKWDLKTDFSAMIGSDLLNIQPRRLPCLGVLLWTPMDPSKEINAAWPNDIPTGRYGEYLPKRFLQANGGSRWGPFFKTKECPRNSHFQNDKLVVENQCSLAFLPECMHSFCTATEWPLLRCQTWFSFGQDEFSTRLTLKDRRLWLITSSVEADRHHAWAPWTCILLCFQDGEAPVFFMRWQASEVAKSRNPKRQNHQIMR